MPYVTDPATADRNAAIAKRYTELLDMGASPAWAQHALGLRFELAPLTIERIANSWAVVSDGAGLDPEDQALAAVAAAWPRRDGRGLVR